ncbi:hypothetical protein V6U90_07980 [Micromonospora sp. CPCC 206060]|uniref:DUF6907 domain-containing protein n=1 Tax=Micromonospora sp. CPCC 206060 TaxID=3122406 RepID=UPI002FF018D2
MSARTPRRKRWEQPSTRPGTRALASRFRRERYTSTDLDAVIDTSMDAGMHAGRRDGARDAFEFLAEFIDDPTELVYQVGRRVLHDEIQEFLDAELVRRARDANPEKFGRLADIIRAHDSGDVPYEQFRDDLEALAREVGVFPPDEPLPVAGLARAAEEAEWWADPPPVDGADELLDEVEAFLTCPPWCTVSHADPAELRNDSICDLRQHTRTVAVVERDGQRVAQVDIVACDNLSTGERGAAEVMIVELRDGYSPEEAEQIAAGLVEAARIVRDSR